MNYHLVQTQQQQQSVAVAAGSERRRQQPMRLDAACVGTGNEMRVSGSRELRVAVLVVGLVSQR